MTDVVPEVAEVPRIIWTLWLQGWEQAPEVVRACLATWRRHNPGWAIHALTESTLREFLDNEAFAAVDGKAVEPEAFSDVARLALLQRYGGVWADSTLYCLRPLDEWIHRATPRGFFAFERPGPGRMLSSWFLAARKGSHIIQRWRDRAERYWRVRGHRDHYFWVHHLFEECYGDDEHFRDLWDATPKVSADGPHRYLPYEQTLARPASAEDRLVVESAIVPMLKLTHKFEPSPSPADSVHRYLIDRAVDRPRESRRLLIAWYGSFDGHGTIGDLLSLESVTSHLVGRGYRVSHATAADVGIPGAERVNWETSSPDRFDALIFVCGPILKTHPLTSSLFEKFRGCRTIGVGVSMFPEGHFNHVNPFEYVLAREGRAERFEDVAIVSPSTTPPRPGRSPGGPATVGIVLRGEQFEYGDDVCLWAETETMARQAALAVVDRHGGQVVVIENHLRRSGLSPAEIEASYADCDLIITSRFHGAMLAIRHRVPFIAIDQIKGGAKVNSLLGESGWPHLFRADAADAEQITQIALDLIAGGSDQALMAARDLAIRNANLTLSRLDEWIGALG